MKPNNNRTNAHATGSALFVNIGRRPREPCRARGVVGKQTASNMASQDGSAHEAGEEWRRRFISSNPMLPAAAKGSVGKLILTRFLAQMKQHPSDICRHFPSERIDVSLLCAYITHLTNFHCAFAPRVLGERHCANGNDRRPQLFAVRGRSVGTFTRASIRCRRPRHAHQSSRRAENRSHRNK